MRPNPSRGAPSMGRELRTRTCFLAAASAMMSSACLLLVATAPSLNGLRLAVLSGGFGFGFLNTCAGPPGRLSARSPRSPQRIAFRMARLYGCAVHLTAQNGGVRAGQWCPALRRTCLGPSTTGRTLRSWRPPLLAISTPRNRFWSPREN
jgi:hypothetical protein